MYDNGKLLTYLCTDENETKSRQRFYPDGTRWDEVLSDFIDYLSYIYGYDIKEWVDITPPYTGDYQ